MPDYTGGQFPSLDGDLEAEIAQRTEPDTSDSWFRHVFTVHNRAHTVGLPEDHDVHLANHVAVLQRALQQGLHPKAQPELESEEPCPSDPVNHTNLTYRVQVVPAVADTDPFTTVTPSNPYGDPSGQTTAPPGSSASGRWVRGEAGVDEHGETLLPPQKFDTGPVGAGGVAPAEPEQTISETETEADAPPVTAG